MQETIEPPSESDMLSGGGTPWTRPQLANLIQSYTAGQYRTWMEEAGFGTITRADPEGDLLVRRSWASSAIIHRDSQDHNHGE